MYRGHVLVCGGTGCVSGEGTVIFKKIEQLVKEASLDKEIKVIHTGCFGLCASGPIVIVYPEGSFYEMVKPADCEEIVNEHIIKGRIVKRLLYTEVDDSGKNKSLENTNFYKAQLRVTLRLCGLINPECIDEYIAYDGYQALAMVLAEKTPQDVIDMVKASGLRGRGGGGFPTGMKWQFAKNSVSDIKYVCCNADEGDPGAFMDRSILEGDPHALIEAMIIAGYAVGASEGYVYVRAEYPIAVTRLQKAVEQAREYGLLGKNIFGSNHNFDLFVRLGSGAFVCGEETALMTSIEGKRGEPRVRPPFPAVKGLWGKPTVLNNVETFANIPQILLRGPEWFAAMGTATSKGTKVFALGGNISNIGLVEIPMGTTLRTVVEEIGGGIPKGKKFKAAQTGGPSGGCIPACLLDTPIDYDNLLKVGSMMGSGGLIIMDEDNCMVDIAKFFLDFTKEESCGKCTPCRIGTTRLLEYLDKISEGKAQLKDIEDMEALCHYIKDNSLCGLGQTAPNPVLSTLHYFRDEYLEHINNKKCPAGVCKSLLSYVVNDLCKGCTLCIKKCPASAIEGTVRQKHFIDMSKCVKCGVCIDVCKFKAIDIK